MKTITVKTGFGYFRDVQGHVVSKAELPPGEHQILDGFNYTELPNQVSLDALQVWQDPAGAQAEENEKKIQERIRKLAVNSLISDGDLPEGYE